MNLINPEFRFNLDLQSDLYQPIIINSVSGNAYIISAQFKAHDIQGGFFILNQINFKIHNINDGEFYNIIDDVQFTNDRFYNERAFHICMKSERSPSFDAFRCSFPVQYFNPLKKVNLQFHVNYNCSDGSIGSDEWPCNVSRMS